MILRVRKFVATFYEKELPKANQTESRITKVIKTIKGYDNLFNSCIDKKDIANKMSYFPEPYNRIKNKIKV